MAYQAAHLSGKAQQIEVANLKSIEADPVGPASRSITDPSRQAKLPRRQLRETT
jgi:hypothetical protein